MNYQRRKMRPKQPAIPDTPKGQGVQGSGSGMGMGFKGTQGNGTRTDGCCGAQGGGMSGRGQKGY